MSNQSLLMEVLYDRIISSGSNQLSHVDQMLIQDFLRGKVKTNPYHPHRPKTRIVLNEVAHPLPNLNRLSMEYIILELDFEYGKWRKIKRTTKRLLYPDVVIEQCESDENASTGIWDANGNRRAVKIDHNINQNIQAPLR